MRSFGVDASGGDSGQTEPYRVYRRVYDLRGDWKGELLDVLKSMEPSAFERLSMRLVKEAGFRNVEVLGKSGDGGIDGVGVYKVSLVSFPTYSSASDTREVCLPEPSGTSVARWRAEETRVF